jgi:two-component system, cell cycle sensor histidine kinase and response regulator CckA
MWVYIQRFHVTEESIHILHVEDDPTDGELLHILLSKEKFPCTITRVDSKECLLSELKRGNLDLIISDFSLPSLRGKEVLELSRATCPHVPFIYYSGTIGEDTAIEALLSGATDYVLKGNPKRLIPAIHRALKEVEQKIEKTRLEQQFLQAQKMEAVGRLAGGIAHDFNNTLAVILGTSDVLLDELEEMNPVRDGIEEIQKAAQHASSLTKQLLAFSRKQVLNPAPVQLSVMVEKMGKMLQRLIGEDVEVSLRLDPDLNWTIVDPHQIEQVLANLVVNARDAMPRGGKLTIETSNVTVDAGYQRTHLNIDAGRYVMLAITDTGHGMDSETQNRIFEPFFTTKPSGQGTGLGLSTVLGIVEQSGGHIWVYSEVGKGTTFKVYFPQSNKKPAGKKKKEKVIILNADLAGKTILVVEDEEMVRKVIQKILTREGFRVFVTSSAVEALSTYEKERASIDLVLTDLLMPQMGGQELAEHLKKLCPKLPIIFMSGYTENAIVHQGILDRGIHFLEKPFEAQRLLEKVREVLVR